MQQQNLMFVHVKCNAGHEQTYSLSLLYLLKTKIAFLR